MMPAAGTQPVTRPSDTDADVENALLHQVAAGDLGRPLEQLYARYERRLYNLGLKLLGNDGLAEELVQETFLRVWRAAGRLRPPAGQCRPVHLRDRPQHRNRSLSASVLPTGRGTSRTWGGRRSRRLARDRHGRAAGVVLPLAQPPGGRRSGLRAWRTRRGSGRASRCSGGHDPHPVVPRTSRPRLRPHPTRLRTLTRNPGAAGLQSASYPLGMARSRLGVAFVLEEPVRTEILGLRRALGCPSLLTQPPHITLVPPVNVRAEDIDQVLETTRIVCARSSAMRVRIGPIRTFAPVSPVLYLAVEGTTSRRIAGVREAVFTGPLLRKVSYAYIPHCTLHEDASAELQQASLKSLAEYRRVVDIRSLEILRQEDDRVWRTLASFPLGPPVVRGRGSVEVSFRSSTTVSVPRPGRC